MTLVVVHHALGCTDFGSQAVPHSGLFYLVVHAVGWVGVPIFFVLSGFLICDMLMREYIETGRVRLGRFFIRRALKIYPPFYLCLALYVVFRYQVSGHVETERLLRAVFFVQNYGIKGLMGVDWSLAVEEHFYLAIGLLAAWLARPRADGKRHLAAWNCIPWLAAILVVVCLWLRLQHHPAEWMATHVRIDAPFAGAAVAWFYNTRREQFIRVFRRLFWWAVGAFVLVSIPAAQPEAMWGRFFLDTWYLALITLVLVPVMGACVVVRVPGNLRLWRWASFIGRNSYCTYLFHLPFIMVTSKIWAALNWYPPFWIAMAWVTFGSMAAGILVTRLVEIPVLRLRDLIAPRPVPSCLVPVPEAEEEIDTGTQRLAW